jgi:HPt (histidine-containing phosphotransfer) domain-containing protein
MLPIAELPGASEGTPQVSSPVEWETVLRRCSGKPALAEKVLGKLASQAEAALVGMAASVASGDAVGIASLAHGLKGAAGMASASDLQAVAARLEEMGRSADLQLATTAIDQLKAEIDRLSEFVAESPKRALSGQSADLKNVLKTKMEEGD